MTNDLLAQIRKECNLVGFDWPSNDTQRSGPPERVIYSDPNAIRNAVWHRSKLLRYVDGLEMKLARCRSAMEANDPLNAREIFGEPK